MTRRQAAVAPKPSPPSATTRASANTRANNCRTGRFIVRTAVAWDTSRTASSLGRDNNRNGPESEPLPSGSIDDTLSSKAWSGRSGVSGPAEAPRRYRSTAAPAPILTFLGGLLFSLSGCRAGGLALGSCRLAAVFLRHGHKFTSAS